MLQKISIIGCGWLGLPLGKFLAEKKYHVKGSTTSADKLSLITKAGIEAYKIIVSDQLEGESKDFFNSDILIVNIPPKRRLENIQTAHPQQIKAILAEAKKGSIQQILFISSTGVYGNENRVLTETDALNPVRNSGEALAIIEAFLQKEKDLQVTILRMAGLVGGDRKAGRFLAGKRDIPNGQARVNMVHREDCIQVIYQIIKQEKWGGIYNVCADEHPTREAFYLSQAKKQGFELPQFAEGGEAAYKIISNQKIKAALGYTFLHPDPMEF